MTRPRRAPMPVPPLPAAGVPPHRRLWQLRAERRISLAELGRLAGLRPATICEIERGKTDMPEPRTLDKLATAFGMSPSALRRQLGMHGPRQGRPEEPSLPEHDMTERHGWSPRAEQIAALVETLPTEEQEFIHLLCGYLQARRRVDLNHIIKEEPS